MHHFRHDARRLFQNVVDAERDSHRHRQVRHQDTGTNVGAESEVSLHGLPISTGCHRNNMDDPWKMLCRVRVNHVRVKGRGVEF